MATLLVTDCPRCGARRITFDVTSDTRIARVFLDRAEYEVLASGAGPVKGFDGAARRARRRTAARNRPRLPPRGVERESDVVDKGDQGWRRRTERDPAERESQ